jgi:hypothetical protein
MSGLISAGINSAVRCRTRSKVIIVLGPAPVPSTVPCPNLPITSGDPGVSQRAGAPAQPPAEIVDPVPTTASCPVAGPDP